MFQFMENMHSTEVVADDNNSATQSLVSYIVALQDINTESDHIEIIQNITFKILKNYESTVAFLNT